MKKAQGVKLGRPSSINQEIAQRIVRERKSGQSLEAIADGLNADGVPTPRGGARWRPAASNGSCNAWKQVSGLDLCAPARVVTAAPRGSQRPGMGTASLIGFSSVGRRAAQPGGVGRPTPLRLDQ